MKTSYYSIFSKYHKNGRENKIHTKTGHPHPENVFISFHQALVKNNNNINGH